MNQARTTYQSDFTPLDWLQNNFNSHIDEFCSSENIDECVKFISQEFCALGYPSIYSSSNDCPLTVNCDIVKLLNTTFELLRSCSNYTQAKEDLESRNQRLTSDLNALNKKNSQLKNSLEVNERKLVSALERERQLKEKNKQLTNLLKSERDETKRLTAQFHQQKVAHQHKIRKYENDMNLIKAKINQLLSDKNPNKRIASMTSSHTLPRSTGQRGKWKTGTAATSLAEDMYSSIITNYENRVQDLYKEMINHRRCLQSILSQMFEAISFEQNCVEGNFTTSEEFVLSAIKLDSEELQSIEEKFKHLLPILKKMTSEKACHRRLEDKIALLSAQVSEYEKILRNKEAQKDESLESLNYRNTQINESDGGVTNLQMEKLKLDEEKIALSKSLQNIEKEQADLSAQKVAFLRLAMQQKLSSKWHQGLNTLPSISVITSCDGTTTLPNNQLKLSVSSPEQVGQSLSPFWKSGDEAIDKELHSKSDSSLVSEDTANQPTLSSCQTANLNLSDSDLPSWAVNPSVQGIVISETPNAASRTSHNISSESIDLASEPSSEETSLLRLKAAMQDIEQRKMSVS